MTSSRLTRRAVLAATVAATTGGIAFAGKAITRRALTGVWQGGLRTDSLVITGEVIFYGNGTYQRMHRLGQLMSTARGPYTIAENWIHFEVEDYEPKYYQGVYQHPPPSETWVVDHFDGRVIRGMIGNATWFEYRRQG